MCKIEKDFIVYLLVKYKIEFFGIWGNSLNSSRVKNLLMVGI